MYSIKNPSEDGKVLPETACQWISELDASLAGVISFVAESNYDSEPREAIVSIAYEGETYEVVLKQGTEELPEVPVFSFEVDNIKETSLEFSIFPADKEMTYIGMLNEKSYIDQFATDEEYFADDMSFFKESALNLYIPIEDYLAMILKTGDVTGEYVNMLTPETDYYIYAYGMNTDCMWLTEMYKTEARTKAMQMNGMTFDIACEPYKNTVEMTVIPSDPGQTYLFSIYPQSEVSKDGIAEKYQEYLDTMMKIYIQQFGITPEEFIEDAAYTGNQTYLFKDLLDNTPYYAFAVSVASFGIFNSEVEVVEVTTGPEADVSFRLEYDKYFDGTEMEAIDPVAFAGASGKAVLPVKAVTTGNVTGFYYHVFTGDYTDPSVITDDIAINSVRFTGTSDETHVYFVNYDELNTFMGVAVDADGNYWPVWREAFSLSADGVSPADEYGLW